MKRLVCVLFAVLTTVGLRASAGETVAPAPEQAVSVHFNYGNADWKPFFAFEKTLEDAIGKSGVGAYDGNELAVDGSDGSLYMYGPDADKLFKVAKPILLSTTLLRNITVTLRYGSVKDKLARVVKVRLSS
ncbi:MAG TPA: hypothetical protein VHW95_01740 [Steroidobacteraceae bacterium]|jgi:hypothetical protein|nr:hypothetical protein [Steroidobacteraceae bacterium]